MNKDLLHFIKSTTQEMDAEYHRIQSRVKEDPGTAGDQGELNWKQLLENWLPSLFKMVTKGRIISHDGIATPQIDLLILRPEYPVGLLSKNLYLAEGVLAAFECKITLKREHLRKAFENSVLIKKSVISKSGSLYKEVTSPIIYGLLAHSTSITSKTKSVTALINDRIIKEDYCQISHPREMLDLICIANLATWSSTKIYKLPIPDKTNLHTTYTKYAKELNEESDFYPIGSLITKLIYKIAWEYEGLRPIAEYFSKSKISGSGGGKLRSWGSEIFSDSFNANVKSTMQEWNEWKMTI